MIPFINVIMNTMIHIYMNIICVIIIIIQSLLYIDYYLSFFSFMLQLTKTY